MFIGLLGGTFNPIHNGHLHIARHIYRLLRPERILFIPTGYPPHKPSTSLASADHRLAMVKLAIQPYSYFDLYDREACSPGTSYSYDTLTRLQREFPPDTRFGFIIGLDAFLDIQSWKYADQLFNLCHFIVCSRPGMSFTDIHALSFFPKEYNHQTLKGLDKGTTTHLEVPIPLGKPLILVSVPPSDISASVIRDHLYRREPVGDWLPPLVESYILKHHLYQCPQ
jgi:nicotinate-nucleotide adenylyltransferase